MFENKLKWLLIDLDNTILDFDRGASQSLKLSFETFGIGDHAFHSALYFTINRRCWSAFERGEIDVDTLKARRFELFVQEADIAVDPVALNRFYLHKLSLQIDEIEGARSFLDWAFMKYDLLLATNGLTQVQRPRIQNARIDHYFKHLVISEEIGSQKPETAYFDHAFDLMGQPDREEVMIVGDNLSSDIKGGIEYGIRTCWFNPNGKPNNSKVTPHIVINDVRDLKKLL